jgi:uncharacterized protein GlcG (DUF336 family)
MRSLPSVFAALALTSGLSIAAAGCGDDKPGPSSIPTFTPNPILSADDLHAGLVTAVSTTNGGLDLPMWATVVDRAGVVVAVVFSGATVDDQWPGSRAISAQKANTANDFSLDGLALSTANLFAPTQPGGSLFGLQESNPVDTDVVYGGDQADYGTAKDFMVGKKPGGVNVFGGGLALYDQTGAVIGAVGVSGDTSCADHNIAWRVRDAVGLDNVPGGVDPASKTDDIIYDITPDANGHPVSASGFGHPKCGGKEDTFDMPTLYPIH